MQVHFTGFHPGSQTPIKSKCTGNWDSRQTRICRIGGFTLVELLVAMAILSLMTVLMLSVVTSAQNLWKQNASRTEQFREARRAFERINERLAQATLNVYWDYVDASGNPRSATGFSYTSGTFVPKSYFRLSELRYIQTGGTNIASLQQYLTSDSYPNTGPRGGTLKGGAIFFQAPIGQSTNTGRNSLLNTVGFFIEQGSDLSMQPTPVNPTQDPAKAKIRFRVYEMLEPSENLTIYSLTSGSANYQGSLWFTKPVANTAYSHRLADNIVALLFRADYTDKSGNSVNSYGYTSAPKRPLASLNLNPLSQPIEENNLPPNIHVTMIAVDEISGRRIKDLNITLPDPQYDTTDPANSVDPADPLGLPYFEKQLLANHLNYRKFESTVKIGSSKWSTK
ncbi:MAG: prepilin-type N-terminal cleavage/methylation domain-containing protein [Verrucomicrobiota bacterium]